MPIRTAGFSSLALARPLLTSLTLLVISGCAASPARFSLPTGIKIASRISVAAASPVAWHPAADKVAIVRDGLDCWTLEDDEVRPLAGMAPTALAWSPDGEQLAAVLPAGADSRLLLLSATGEQLKEKLIPGRVPRLSWTSANELLFIAATLKEYQFGGNFSLRLYRWRTTEEPAGEPLFETTVMPRTIRQWGEMLPDTAIFAVAPLGDAILFARLRDPPAFYPYLEIVLRHLATGREQPVTATLPLNAALPLFAADGEKILFGDGSRTNLHDPWTQKNLATWPQAGKNLALSASGQYLLLDGRLFREGEQIAGFPATTEGWFAPAGNRLLLRQGNKLLLLVGLTEPATAAISTEVREHLLLLRRWRSSGLITQTDFIEQIQKDPPR